MKLSSIVRCVRLPRNEKGRDLVVGDLHGHRVLFEAELEHLDFNPARDRVLSVGDLIDRGPDSLATLALIEEPWFHAVLGNHELMLLNFLGFYSSRLHSRKSFRNGDWIKDALCRHRRLLDRTAERVAALPLALHVEDDLAFNVTHADLHLIGFQQERLMADEVLSIHAADTCTSSRTNITEALRSPMRGLTFGRHQVQLSDAPFGDLPLTYVGHSPIQYITVHNSHIYVDQRVCAGSTPRLGPRVPTVLEHRPFAQWLGGVRKARNKGMGTAVGRIRQGAFASAS